MGYKQGASGAPPTDQLLVRFADGHEEVVPKSAIEGTFVASNAPTTEPEPAPTEPPTVVDVPYASQNGPYLNCTMGNWNAMETGTYAYQWQCDGVDVGLGTEIYQTIADDVGKSFTCTVTATNDLGEASSTSNAVVVTAA
jgi:hypothetical protein